MAVWFVALIAFFGVLHTNVYAGETWLTASSSQPISLTECIKIAEYNYEPLKLSLREMNIAKLKLDKSTRDIFPSLSVVGEETSGDTERATGSPGFKEQSYGIQVAQPLFQGGKLWNTRNQALAQYKMGLLKIASVKNEMQYAVTEAYYNLVKGLLTRDAYQECLDEIKIYYTMALDLYDKNVINKKDLLASESLYHQAHYQLRNASLEYEKYLWKWAESMGVFDPPQRMPFTALDFTITSFDLDETMREAERYNYDMRLQRFAVEASEYNYGVHKARGYPAVKLEGFYGRSGSAYTDEVFGLKEDYQLGVNLEYAFFGNVLTASRANQKTSPKLGQSTRIDTQATNVAVGILNDGEATIQRDEAKLAYEKALFEEKKTRMKVNSDMREIYLNWKKAVMQLEAATSEKQLAETEYSIAKINFQDSRVSINELMASINKIYTTKISVYEAKVFYLITMAALDKTLGKKVIR